MKNYFIRAELGEGIPSYEFVIKAKAVDEAYNIGEKIIKSDYPDTYQPKITARHITAKQLLKDLTLN